MRLGFTADQQRLVADVQAFLAGWQPVGPDLTDWFAALADRGWSAPGWPERWRGGGYSASEAFLIERTLTLAAAPVLDYSTVHQAGPLLLALADEDICARFLPAMAQGRIRWALHQSFAGAGPLVGRFAEAGFRPETATGLVYGARAATTLATLASDGGQTALVIAELPQTSVQANQPLDPDTVDLYSLEFEVLAHTTTHPGLAERVARGWPESGLCCWSGRLRRQLVALAGAAEADLAEKLAALDVSLSALEVLEERALQALDQRLIQAAHIRAHEVGRRLAELGLEQLGYYQIAAPDPSRQHNELPAQALGAQDAMAELIRYLEDGSAGRRDRLAQRLGLSGDGGRGQ